MGYTYRAEDERRLQRKLIPLNIFVAILALVAAISLIVTPLVRIDLGAMMSTAVEMVPGDSSPDDSESSSAVPDAMMDMLSSLDIVIEVTPLRMANIAFAPQDKKAEMFMDEFVIKSNMFSGIMTAMVNSMIVGMADLAESEGLEASALIEKLEDLGTAKSKDEFITKVDAYVGLLQQQVGSDFDSDAVNEIKDVLGEMYDDAVAEVGANGFSLESLICVAASKGISEESGTGMVVTNYNDLLNGILDGTVNLPSGGDGSDASESLKETMDMLNDVAGYYGYMFYAILFFAVIWLILFLFAFFHIFGKNKRFTMWYAKLFGGVPCLLFGVMPLLSGVLMGALMGETGAAVSGLMGAISTLTWISGACYLLMWLVSIFWAFPIKRKIRKLR